MPLIQIPQSVRPCQIEFGEGVERSKPGALYFTPGSTKQITKGELEWIEKHHKQFAAALVVLPFDETKGRLAKQKAAEASKEDLVKRPKDKMSKAKQRAKELLKKAADKETAKAPEPKKVAEPEPAPEPAPEPEPKPEPDEDNKKGKKKKWG
jgi:hypothetical protein